MCLGMNPDILRAGRALRLDLEPQLRGPPGQAAGARTWSARRWPRRQRSPAASSTSGSGSCRDEPVRVDRRATSRRSTAPTSTPIRSSRSSSSSGSSAPASASSCSTTGDPRRRDRAPAATRSWSPARTSAAAPRASMRPGRSRTTASARSCARRSPTSSTRNCIKNGLLPVNLSETDCGAVADTGGADRPRRPDRRLRSRRGQVRDRRGGQAPSVHGLDEIRVTLQASPRSTPSRRPVARPRPRHDQAPSWSNEPVEWNAHTYHKVAAPQEEWGRGTRRGAIRSPAGSTWYRYVCGERLPAPLLLRRGDLVVGARVPVDGSLTA